jgi:hypothetical protein
MRTGGVSSILAALRMLIPSSFVGYFVRILAEILTQSTPTAEIKCVKVFCQGTGRIQSTNQHSPSTESLYLRPVWMSLAETTTCCNFYVDKEA